MERNRPELRSSMGILQQKGAAINTPAIQSLSIAEDLQTVDTFTLKSLHCWKDLCNGEHVVTAVKELLPICSSLPAIVHSRERIFSILIQCVTPATLLSRATPLDVIAAFARDIQDMFVAFLPELIQSIHTATAKIRTKLEILNPVFQGLKKILQQMRPHLSGQLGVFLTRTIRPLIVHLNPLVQKLTCRSTAHLLRPLPSNDLRLALKSILALINQDSSTDDVLQAYALLVAQACLGVSNNLHTKSTAILRALLNSHRSQGSKRREMTVTKSGPIVADGDSTMNDIPVETEWYESKTVQFVRTLFKDYLLKELTGDSAKKLWKVVISGAETDVEQISTEMGCSDGIDPRDKERLAKDLALCCTVASQLLSNSRGLFLCDLDHLLRLLQILVQSNNSLQNARSSARSANAWNMYVRSVSWLLLHISRVKARYADSDAWPQCKAELSKLIPLLQCLSLSDFVELSKKGAGWKQSLGFMAIPVLQRLAQLLVTETSVYPDTDQQMLWTILCKIVRSLSSIEVARDGDGLFGNVRFLSSLEQAIQQWPENRWLQKSTGSSAESIAAMGFLLVECFAKISCSPKRTTEVINTLLYSLSDSMKMTGLEESDISALYCQMRILLFRTDSDPGMEITIEDVQKRWTEHLNDAFTRLARFPAHYGNLQCVAMLMKMVENKALPKSAENNEMEVDSNGAVYDISAVLTVENMSSWVTKLEVLLSNADSRIRRVTLEILSTFDKHLEQHLWPQSRLALFTKLSEIESQDLDGKSRRAVRLVTEIEDEVKRDGIPHQLLSAAFHGLLGLLQLAHSRNWPPAVSALSALISHQFHDFWPTVLEHIAAATQSVIMTKRETEADSSSEESSIPLFSLKRIYQEHILMQSKTVLEGRKTDTLTRLLQLLLVVKGRFMPDTSRLAVSYELLVGIDPSQLRDRLSDWIPLLLKWTKKSIEDSTEFAAAGLESAGVLRVTQGYLATLSRIDSLNHIPYNQELCRVLISLISWESTQETALNLLFKFEPGFLNRYRETLTQLVDKTQRQNVLIHLSLDRKDGSIIGSDREKLLPILIHLLYPHIHSFALSGRRRSPDDPVLSFLSNAEPHELTPLIEIIFMPWTHLIEENHSHQSKEASDMIQHRWWYFHLKQGSLDFWTKSIRIEGFIRSSDRIYLLSQIDCLMSNLGRKLEPYLAFIVAWLVQILDLSIQQNESCEMEPADTVHYTVSLFTAFTRQYSAIYHKADFLNALVPHLHRLLQRWDNEIEIAEIEAVVELMSTLISVPSIFRQLCSKRTRDTEQAWISRLLRPVLALLNRPTMQNDVHATVLDIVEQCISYEQAGVLSLDNDALLQWILRHLKEHILNNPAAQKRGRRDMDREMKILEDLLSMHGNADAISGLSHAMLSVLANQHNNVHADTAVINALRCLSKLFEKAALMDEDRRFGGVFTKDELWSFANALAKKSVKLKSMDGRSRLAQAFSALASLLPELQRTARLFTDLTSMCTDELEKIDYKRRLSAFAELTPTFWKREGLEKTEILQSACIFDICNGEDFTLRQAASSALQRLVCADGPDGLAKAIIAEVHWYIYHKICRVIGPANLAVRQELLVLLWTILRQDKQRQFPWMSPLFNEDKETDFFHNVSHFQIYKRLKAWQRVAKLLQEYQTKTDSNDAMAVDIPVNILKMMKPLTPLLLHTIFDAKSHDKKGKKNMVNPGQESSLVEICVQVLSVLASILPWNQYRQLLHQLIARVMRTEQASTGMIRSLCVVVDAFHFDLSVESTNAAKSEAEISDVDDDPNEPSRQTQHRLFSPLLIILFVLDIEEGVNCIYQRVIPALNSLLLMDSEEKARKPVAVSLAKLYSKLPKDNREDLSGLLLKLANLLLHRVQHIRDDAREVYVSVATALGSSYLYNSINCLIKVLPVKGYTAHVLEHSIHAVVEKVGAEAENSKHIDAVLEPVLAIVDVSLFGEPAEARAAKTFASKYKEAKTTRSKDTFLLLCRFCSFLTHNQTIVQFLREKLSLCDVLRYRQMVQNLLEGSVQGFLTNSTASTTDKLQFVHEMIIQGIHDEEEVEETLNYGNDQMSIEQMQNNVNEQRRATRSKYLHLLLEGALTLFRSLIKKISMTDEEMARDLDVFVPLLITCLHARDGNTSSLALKSLGLIMPLPLPSLKKYASEAGSGVIRLLDSVTNMNDPVAQDCLRLLARILRAGEWFKPTQMQVNSLLTLIHVDLEELSEQQAAFKLLRAIIDRKIIVPKVYDLMLKIRDMMIRSQSGPVRQMASSLFLQFLLSYPQSDKQIEQHLVFVLANLPYEYETGRTQALNMVHQIIIKFPAAFVEHKYGLFYLPLVKRLGLESVPELRSTVVIVFKSLAQRISSRLVQEMIRTNLAWMTNPAEELHVFGIQALSILFGTHRHLCIEFEDDIMHFCEKALSLKNRVLSTFEDEQILEWGELYSALHLVEEISYDQPDLLPECLQLDKPIWNEIVTMLSFPHTWVRSVAARLIGRAFCRLDSSIQSLQSETPRAIVGGKTAAELAFACYAPLESSAVDEKLTRQCSKNLVWLAPILHVQSSSFPRKSRDSQTPRNRESNTKSEPALTLMGMIHRMNRFCSQPSQSPSILTDAALKFIGSLAIRLNAFNCLETYLPLMLQPISRILEQKDPKQTAKNSEDLANQVMWHIREVVDREVFIKAYAAAKKEVEENKAARKSKEAVQKIVDPQGTSKRRLERNRKSNEAKKRRLSLATSESSQR